MITAAVAINIAVITVEVIAVIALWVWYFFDSKRLRNEFDKAKVDFRVAHKEDPNSDLKEARSLVLKQSGTMLPMIAAFASLSVFFSDTLISYFTLFPLIIALACYYVIFATYQPTFILQRSRPEILERSPQDAIKQDNNNRKWLLKRFIVSQILRVIGHINFMVAIFAFITGTIITRSMNLTSVNKSFVMLHAILLSYILAFLIEALVIKNPTALNRSSSD